MDHQSGLHEECGVFGAYDAAGGSVTDDIYYGLFALQHRGQESCGIAVSDTNGPKRRVMSHKGLGLVSEVFHEEELHALNGNIGVGHVRYSTTGETSAANAQPLVLNYVKGTLAIAHNGNLVNAAELRRELEYTGAIFQTTIDSEVIAYHIARARLNASNVEEAVRIAMMINICLTRCTCLHSILTERSISEAAGSMEHSISCVPSDHPDVIMYFLRIIHRGVLKIIRTSCIKWVSMPDVSRSLRQVRQRSFI